MTILEIKDVYAQYISSTLEKKQTVYALNGVSFSVNKGEIFSIAGESGCGKSTLLKTIMKLTPLSSGEILYNSKPFEKDFRQKIQMIFQTPSLNPKMKIYDIVEEPLKINKIPREERKNRVINILEDVGLSSDVLDRYPHEFSGGQKQRISIARALVMKPEILLADEPVSALDISIRGQIINLLKSLQKKYNLTIIFISHDLNVIRYISDRVAVMYLGEIVEQGLTEEIFSNPLHPYTQALLSANPSFKGERIALKGELPSPLYLSSGCKFNTRCPRVMPICKNEHPEIKNISNTHFVKCHLF